MYENNAFFFLQKKAILLSRNGKRCYNNIVSLPHSQVVRHRTMTPTLRSFESNWGSQLDCNHTYGFFFLIKSMKYIEKMSKIK